MWSFWKDIKYIKSKGVYFPLGDTLLWVTICEKVEIAKRKIVEIDIQNRTFCNTFGKSRWTLDGIKHVRAGWRSSYCCFVMIQVKTNKPPTYNQVLIDLWLSSSWLCLFQHSSWTFSWISMCLWLCCPLQTIISQGYSCLRKGKNIPLLCVVCLLLNCLFHASIVVI